jgi:glycosyltransferase involved in cell wall biosynthesis
MLTDRGCEKIILYLWRPEFAPALASISFDLSCYHIVDEYSFSDSEIPIDLAEVKLITEVDQVFIHSPGLFERFGSLNPSSAHIPNGVEFKNFATKVPEPLSLTSISRPRIGYMGWIKAQLDWALLCELTKKHRDWSFVFVGPTGPHPHIFSIIEELASRSNVHFLGAKSVRELSAYPQHFDVCIMPYSQRDYSAQFIYPLKLHEYLASGSPVVGTRIRTLEDFSSVVSLAVTPEDWSKAISASLDPEMNSASKRWARQATAKRHDWEALVERIAIILAGRLGYKIPVNTYCESGRESSDPTEISPLIYNDGKL